MVGARGAGLSTLLLGTATELAACGSVPVLVAGGEPDTRPAASRTIDNALQELR